MPGTAPRSRANQREASDRKARSRHSEGTRGPIEDSAIEALTQAVRADPAGGRAPLARADAGTRAQVISQLQQTHGNATVHRMLASESGPGRTGTPLAKAGAPIQRVLGIDDAAIAAAGVAFAGVGLVQNQINGSQGGLTYSSDQLTYGEGERTVGRARHVSRQAARFFSAGLIFNNATTFKLHGEFGQGQDGKPRMFNVYIDLDETTTYAAQGGSALSFSARGLQTPYGTPEDPRLRFVCSGRFDPAGLGDCAYRVVLEVDKGGFVSVVESKLINGSGNLMQVSPIGFALIV